MASTAWGLRRDDWWIGLNDEDADGTYGWISGSTAPFRFFEPGKPREPGRCVSIRNVDS
ncbi:MAG: C-type lectin domain-containing protein, partial [Planctomycetes bacterium]|nr:C-type lectin domain-containing protein [Planctomycetota bacterium]